MSRRVRHHPAPASQVGTAVATLTPTVAQAAGVTASEYAIDLQASLARGSFEMIANPRRRRLRKGDGGFHCDYRTVEELRNISRWLEYHSGTYGGAINNWSQFCVGEGPAWVPASSDAEWNLLATQAVTKALDAKLHDVRGKLGWSRWLKTLAVAIVRDGMMGVVHSANGAAQLVEAERILSVDSNRIGQIVTYTICDTTNGFLDFGTKQPIAGSMMDLPAITTRISQDLGIPLCYSSLDDHDGISDLWQSEIDAAAESVRPWLRISHVDGGLPGGATIQQTLTGGQPAKPEAIPGRRVVPEGWVRTPSGNIMGIPPGLKAEVHQPDRPNLDVPEFSKQVIRVASMVLLPYELLFVDQADVSYSNGRMIRKIGNTLLDSFRGDYLTPSAKRIILGLLKRAMLRKELRWPAKPNEWQQGHLEWPTIPEHDRIKERQADSVDLANGTTSLKGLIGEKWQPVLKQRAAEYAFAAQLVIEHNQSFASQPITLAHIIGDPAKIAALAMSLGTSPAADQAAPAPAPAVKPAAEPKPAPVEAVHA